MNVISIRRVRQAGFTLIEISVALAVIATMAAMSVPVLRAEQQRSKEAQLRSALIQIRQALDEYKQATDSGLLAKAADASGYPATLEVLAQGQERTTVGAAKRLVFLRRIPRDPFANQEDAEKPPHLSWGLRAYASTADQPQSGIDVFDVYSKSNKIGSNGLEYSKW
jgi:general secretion pathway protein G